MKPYFETDLGKLYHGDCLEIMDYLISQDIKFDAILTDPPYGTTRCNWDLIIPFSEMWERVKALRNDTTPIVLFGDEPFSSYLRISNIREYRYDWIFEKLRATNFFSAYKQPLKMIENIVIFYKKQCLYNPQYSETVEKKRIVRHQQYSNKYKGIMENDNKFFVGNSKKYNVDKNMPTRILFFPTNSNLCHPTQKPKNLLLYLVKTYTNKNDTVLDFTAGSGTTGIACEELSRRWIMIEREKEYCDIIVKRLKNVTPYFEGMV